MTSRRSKSKGVKVEIDNTLVTQSDITLSLSRDSFKVKPKIKKIQQKQSKLRSISFGESYEFSDIDTNALELMLAQQIANHSKNHKPTKLEENDL